MRIDCTSGALNPGTPQRSLNERRSVRSPGARRFSPGKPSTIEEMTRQNENFIAALPTLIHEEKDGDLVFITCSVSNHWV